MLIRIKHIRLDFLDGVDLQESVEEGIKLVSVKPSTHRRRDADVTPLDS